ncbi:hypothetical protein LR48_Vigan07g277200 [Vigna angularis]|uniref:GDSL esterase/lipase n=1 Tax=Phaseolus angularis TaxID=3914 RepID=A0A0L9V214_PHAAN|nr:hypothetical protein LR48_Vigan07g277200 [Vigna angularis]
MDTGNNNNNLATTARCNYPPYGKDFKGGIPTGRFSNGKVPSDLIGYKVGDRGCCGTGTIEVVLLCNRFTPLCSNDLEYVFWDSFHPTESVYKKLISPVIGKYLNKFL